MSKQAKYFLSNIEAFSQSPNFTLEHPSFFARVETKLTLHKTKAHFH